MPKRLVILFALACLPAAAALAQKNLKPWTEWTSRDVEKILDDSPWGQTQVETDTSEMFYKPTSRGQVQPGGGRAAATGSAAPPTTAESLESGRGAEGALNQSTSVKFPIRWLSARPVRQAMAREVALRGDGQLTPALKAFVDSPSDKRTVISVTFETGDQRFGAKVMQAFNSAVTSTLKNSTYLERKDGERIFLAEYVPPQHNTLGAAMFVFPRTYREGPLLTPGGGEVRFVSEFSKSLKLDMKFKVSEMIYEGKLEY